MDPWQNSIRWCWLPLVFCAGCRLLAPSQPVSASLEQPLRAGQLVVNADFALPDSHRLLREVTALRGDMTDLLQLPDSEEPIYVRLFRDGPSYYQYMREFYPDIPPRRAFFVETDTRLAVYAHWSDRVAEDLRHEVAHGYLHAGIGSLPLWLDEGLAEYFEVPRGNAGLNRPHVQLLADMVEHHGWRPNLEQLETLEHCGEMNQHHYAEAWAWVHFLLQTDPSRRELLVRHLQEISANGTADPLSRRLAEQLHQPEETLAEYIVSLRG